MRKFRVESDFEPAGDQPKAINELSSSIASGNRYQTLLGVTGSGKTYTVAKVIERLQRPALIFSHNKTLAAQLYREFKEFFPNNAVEYFISYYDYYQPEAYIPARDLFIEKDSNINSEIERLRLAATMSLLERKDVIVVASVSCIYGLGNPADYRELAFRVELGQDFSIDKLARHLVDLLYERSNDIIERAKFRIKGDVLELYPSYMEEYYRFSFDWDKLVRISKMDVLNHTVLEDLEAINIYPATHFATPKHKLKKAISRIYAELEEQYKSLESMNKLLEAQRIKSRTEYDMELLEELGSCKGIENYSRHMAGREAGAPPDTLLDFFPEDFLTFIDESHVALGQIKGMYEGDRSRKKNLVAFGFRLPSALDNRPLTSPEFNEKVGQVIYISATPGQIEKDNSSVQTEQLVRPTGLLDPIIHVRPSAGQMEDLYGEIMSRTAQQDRVLVTTLTKKMAEELSDYLLNLGIKARYLHSEIEPLERLDIIHELRSGVFDVLIGINLLREGLDIPEVALVAILDADKIGFLRSATSLIQTIGRAARNATGTVLMYADHYSQAMKEAISETGKRRQLQNTYNERHGITPATIKKAVRDIIDKHVEEEKEASQINIKMLKKSTNMLDKKQRLQLIKTLEKEMYERAKNMEFEAAAELRDEIKKLKEAPY